MYYLFLGFSFLSAFSVIRFLSVVFRGLALNAITLLNSMLSAEEDDVKISKMQHHAIQTIKSLCLMILVIALSAGISYGLISLGSLWYTIDLSSFKSILAISVGATIPFIIPFKRTKDGYSELSKLLHRMILNNYEISKKLFRREVKKYAKDRRDKNQFLIVTGLARAGTTSLMTDLFNTQYFSSLDYANMPFLIAPNTWKKWYKPKSSKLKERSHEDGLMIGLNSVEALEEHFFKILAKDDYIKEDCLTTYNISVEDYENYMNYQKVIRTSDDKIYLAKNNNFMLRHHSLKTFNADYKVVVLFREPLTHATSLLNQHEKYKQLQENQPFVLEYMDWLGHHEFGLHQKQFEFSNSLIDSDKNELNFWINSWVNYYEYVATSLSDEIILICYEDYCKTPQMIMNTVLSHLQKEKVSLEREPFNNKTVVSKDFDQALVDRANKIYNSLKAKVSYSN